MFRPLTCGEFDGVGSSNLTFILALPSASPMARPYFLFRSVVAGLVLAAALCPLQVAPGAERPERQYTRDPIRTSRPRTPAEFFKQDAVRFERVRIDMNGLIYADGHSLSLYGAVLIRRNKICNPPDGVRWACGQRAFMALRNLLDGKSIACTFRHIAGPLKAACSVGDNDVAQVLLTEGWAELADGVISKPIRQPRAEKPAFGQTVRRERLQAARTLQARCASSRARAERGRPQQLASRTCRNLRLRASPAGFIGHRNARSS
jgi:endonuclease YncB( thermonuclease family)